VFEEPPTSTTDCIVEGNDGSAVGVPVIPVTGGEVNAPSVIAFCDESVGSERAPGCSVGCSPHPTVGRTTAARTLANIVDLRMFDVILNSRTEPDVNLTGVVDGQRYR
jgi:hypothetical protein